MMKKNVNFANLIYAKNVVNPTLYGIYDYYLYAKPAVNKNKKRGNPFFVFNVRAKYHSLKKIEINYCNHYKSPLK